MILPRCSRAALLVILAFVSSSPSRTQSAQQTSATKLTSRTELVLVPALVKDKAGQHVAGLSQGDFVVLENGKQQQIAIFEEIRTSNQPLPPKPAAAPNE